jgi:transposase
LNPNNYVAKKYFTEEERKTIIESYENGNDITTISNVMNKKKNSVVSLIRRYSSRGDYISENSSNTRPKILTSEEEVTILSWVDESPELTLKQIKEKVYAAMNKTV